MFTSSSFSEIPDSDAQATDQQLSEVSAFSQPQSIPSSSSGLSSVVPPVAHSTPVGPRDVNTFTAEIQPQNHYPAHHPHSGGREPLLPSVPVDGSAYVPSVAAYPPPPMMPSYAPLPPPSSALPVALTLEGESELLTPSLNDDLPPSILSYEEDSVVDSSVPVSHVGGGGGGQITYVQPHPLNQLPGPAMSGVSNPPVPQSVFNVAPAIPVNYHQPPAEVPQFRDQTEHQPTVVPQAHSFISQPQPQTVWHTDQQPRAPDQQAQPAQPAWFPHHHPSQPGPSQPHVPVQMQRPSETPPSSNEILVHQRVAPGPISGPPSYEQAKQLPSQVPVGPPIPPPVPLHPEQGPPAHQMYPHQVMSHQHNQFGQVSQPQYQQPQYQPQYQQPQTVHQPQSENPGESINPEIAERDAKIERLMQLLKEKERETQTRADEEERMKKQQADEKKELTEIKKSLETERNQLEQAKQQQMEAAERERQVLLHKLEEERAQMTLALEQEKRKLQATQVQYMQDLQQREIEFKQMREQYEREIAERQRQNAVNQQLEELRKKENLFSLKQGLPQGWEKRLDSTTGRFYYVDHNTKTTHWNPPTSWLDYQAEMQRQQQEKNRLAQLSQQQEALNARLRAQQQYGKGVVPRNLPPAVAHPSVSTSGGTAQPPVVQPVTPKAPTEPSLKTPVEPPSSDLGPSAKPLPSFDRSTKPPQQSQSTGGSGMPVVPDRSTKPVAIKKPIMTPAILKQKSINLQPVYGSGVSFFMNLMCVWLL